MLEYVGEQNRVEMLAAQQLVVVERLSVADDHSICMLFGLLRRVA